MTRNEFISGLKTALADELPISEIENNVSYYDNYIREQAASSSEEEVLEQLGEPRLIAKTIIETYQLSHGPLYHGGVHHMNYQEGYTEEWKEEAEERTSEEERVYGQGNGNYQAYGSYQIKWYHKLLFGVIAVLVLILLLFIGGIVLKLFFSIGVPLLIVYFIYKLIQSNRRN